MKRKNVVILGSTGSIGINTLKVVEKFSDQFRVVGLSAYNNLKLLEKQVRQFNPRYIAVTDDGARYFKGNLSRSVKVLNVLKELEQLVALKDVDIVVIGMRGSAALAPFLSAVRAGKTVAPANKEALVIAGEIIMREAKRHGAVIVPVDSEQSAIFQCLQGNKRDQLKKVWLTASGGALRDVPQKRFDQISVEEILSHPTWKMGKKITVDSATLMNKGFEVIEACRLFGLDADEIEVLVHPESIVHSMVEYKDGSVIAQLAVTDMRLPIQYAMTYPERLDSPLRSLDLVKLGKLTFRKPDLNKFPSLQLCIHCAKKGGTLPSVLNAADEEAVEAFLQHKIKFTQIYKIVEKVVLKHRIKRDPDLKSILGSDQWAREEARKEIG